MFKSLRLLINLLVVILLFRVLITLTESLTGKIPELEWASPMLILLGVLFIMEVWKWLLGYKAMWQYFNFRDRIVFFVYLTETMLAMAVIAKSQASWIIDLLVGLTSLFLGWLTIRLFGSFEMKKALRMPFPFLQRNPKEDVK